jgi:hypothetical protein
MRLLDDILLRLGPRSWARSRLTYRLLLALVVAARR